MNPINLNKLNNDELSKIMDSFDYILTDCDGELLIIFHKIFSTQ